MNQSYRKARFLRVFGVLVVAMLALTLTRSLSAHNLQTKMVSMVFDGVTLDMLDARIDSGSWTPPEPLLQVGDELGLVIKVVPRDGTDTGVGGYVDFYVPNGVTVIDAGYVVPDGSGYYNHIPMKGQSLIAIGDGPIGAKTTVELSGLTLGPNINGVTEAAVVSGSGLHRGTVAGVYGDTGIFYATDVDTVYGSFGNFTVTNNSGDTITPLNKWDGEQMAAYGIKGTTKPGYPTSPIIDYGDGRGNTPWGLGSGVAGPQSGYAWQFDKDLYDGGATMKTAASFVGPWKRIQYPGSRVSFDQAGLKSTELGIASIDAGSLGFDLSPANPLPPTVSQSDSTSPKTVRWSIGQLTLNVPEYVWVKVKVDTPSAAINDPSGCPVFNAGTFGGDAGGDSNGKDHLWRYYEPSTVEWNGCLALQKPTDRVVIGNGSTFQYPITFYNTSNFPITNLVVKDTLPSNVNFVSAVPSPASTNPLRWNIATLLPGQRVEILVTVTADGNGVMENQVCVTSDQINTCAGDITPVGPFPYLIQNKTANVSSVAPGANVVYTIKIDNIGNGASGSPVQIKEYLPPGFSYVSLGSTTVNGAAVTATVNSTNPNQPIFTVPAAINGGSKLLLTFTAQATAAEGTWCNSFTSLQNNLPLTTGSLACVTIGGGKIGDTIFRDWNGNGVQDPVDEGIGGVTVELRDCGVDGTCGNGDDGPTRTTTTDDDGYFIFEGLTESKYEVEVTDTAGVLGSYTQTADPDGTCLPTAGPKCDDQSAVNLPDGAQILNQDFGYKPGGPGVIGDLVWNDNGAGANTGNGVKDGDEAGIPGVTVYLFEDTNGNGLVDGDDALIGATTTNGSGIYSFSGLAEGLDYIVQVAEDDADIDTAVCTVSGCPIGLSTSNPQAVRNLSGTYNDADFGFYEVPPSSISGKAFQDENANGIFDGGDVPLPDVTVVLYRDTNGNGILEEGEPQVAVTETCGGATACTGGQTSGDYLFEDLGPGSYIVDIEQGDVDIPDGYSPTKDEIAVTLAEGESRDDVDFPFVQALSKSVENLSQATPNNGATGDPGNTLEYSIRPYYAGSQLLKQVTVTDMIPEGTTYVPASANLGGGTSFNDAGEIAKDTYIYEKETIRNFGAEEILFLKAKSNERSRALLQFDLPGIPLGATITAATLTLEKTAGNDDSLGVSVHGVTRSWNEGDKINADCTPDPGGATWLTKDCAVNWSAAGGDFLAAASTTTIAGEATYNWNVTSIVQSWYAGTLANNGLLLKYASETIDKNAEFASREDTTGATLPTLTLSYTTADLTWNLGSSTAAKVGQDNSGLNVYGFSGDGKTSFWKYGIASDTWANSIAAPGQVKEGGALTTDGSFVYALEGKGTTGFWRIDPDAGSPAWQTLPATPLQVKAGGALATDGTYVYALRGDDKPDIWRYTIGCTTSTAVCWVNMPNLTPDPNDGKIKEGGSLTYDGTYIYAVQGNKNLVWRYPVSAGTGGTWQSLTPVTDAAGKAAVIKAGGAITNDGTYLYLMRGDGKTDFWRYPIASGTSGSWEKRAPTPLQVREGGALAYDDAGGIYAFRGAGKPDFWRYDTDSNSWDTSLAALYNVSDGNKLVNVNWGGALVVFGVPGSTTVKLRAFPALVSCKPTAVVDCPVEVTIEMVVTNNSAAIINNVQAPTNLTVCGAGSCPGGATASKLSGPSPSTPENLGIGESRTYLYVYNVTANATNVSQVTFSGEPSPGSSFTAGTSNSVIVTPPLTFRVTIKNPTNLTQIVNTAMIEDKGTIPPTDSNEVVTLLDAGQIGDFHYYDNNGNGVYEPGLGETGVPNATVVLIEDTNGNGVADTGEPAIAVAYTADGTGADPIGYYNFEDVAPGKYVVQASAQTVVNPTVPGEYGKMVATTGEEIAAVITCSPSCNVVDNADFGFIEGAVIEGSVFYDENHNGVFGSTETGLGPVTVTITPPAGIDLGAGPGNPVDIETEPDGSYSIVVPPGNYSITYDTADAAALLPGSPPEGATDKTTPTTINVIVTAGQESKNNNFGIDYSGKIGDTVFNDADGNGAQAPSGEPGLPNVTVQLWRDDGNNGTPDVLLEVKATDANGKYLFEGLDTGNYLVLIATATLPAGYTQTADPDQPGVPCTVCDSKGNADLITDGQVLDTVDFGYKPPAGTYSITGNLWDDADGNGVNNGEDPIPGATVCLYASDGLTLIVCTQTGTNGAYTFPGVVNGTYVVKVDPKSIDPAYVQTGDPDQPGVPCTVCDNQTIAVVSGGNDTGNNFGYQKVEGSISGSVCVGDGNGLCDGSDTAITTEIVITLTFAGPDGLLGTADDVVTTQTTSSADYNFTNLPPGLYQITSNQTPLDPLQALNDADGDDPNNITVDLSSGQVKVTQDFEVYEKPLAIGLANVSAAGDGFGFVAVLIAVVGALFFLTLRLLPKRSKA